MYNLYDTEQKYYMIIGIKAKINKLLFVTEFVHKYESVRIIKTPKI